VCAALVISSFTAQRERDRSKLAASCTTAWTCQRTCLRNTSRRQMILIGRASRLRLMTILPLRFETAGLPNGRRNGCLRLSVAAMKSTTTSRMRVVRLLITMTVTRPATAHAQTDRGVSCFGLVRCACRALKEFPSFTPSDLVDSASFRQTCHRLNRTNRPDYAQHPQRGPNSVETNAPLTPPHLANGCVTIGGPNE
jgi:hypothetical protein